MRLPRAIPQPHTERHFTANASVRDIVIGMSDGLTVPFALAAGISGAFAASHIVVTAGVAELAAGGISMGLGGYLAAQTDYSHYLSEQEREDREVTEVPEKEKAEVSSILREYGLAGDEAQKVTEAIAGDRKRWIDFMMKFELGIEKPDTRRAPISALTIGGSYILGGLIPLLPYMMISQSTRALYASAAVTGIALFIFGAVKARVMGLPWLRSAFETLFIGGVASIVAFGLAKLVTR